MDRRRFLTAVGSGVLLAGCADDDSTADGEAPTEAVATPTATPTATPSPDPVVRNLEPTARWEDGDGGFESESIDATAARTTTYFEYEAEIPVHDGQIDVEYQLTVTEESGAIDYQFSRGGTTSVSDGSSTLTETLVAPVPPEKLSTGSYSAAMTMEDRETGKTSTPAKTSFEVTSPLEPAEVEFGFDGYELLDGWSNVALTWRATNEGQRDGGVVSGMSVRPVAAPRSRETDLNVVIGFDVPAGTTRTYRIENMDFTIFTNVEKVTFRFHRYDFEWAMPVE